MRVSTKALFDLISKSDTKNIKETLEKIVSNKTDISQNSSLVKTEQIKHQNTTELISSLLKDISSKNKSKEVVLETLKQNDIPKSMKSTTFELKSLLELVKMDKTLSKFAPALEKLLLHVKDVEPQTIKTQLEKSGVFFESKLVDSKTQALPLTLKEILLDLKEIVSSNFPKPELHVKQIDNLLLAKKADKSFVDTLINLVRGLKQSKDVPKQIEPMVQKLIDIINKETPLASSNVKEVLANLKQTLVNDKQKNDLHVKIIDQLLNTPKADKFFISDIKTLITNLKDTKNIDKPIVDVTAKLETLVKKSELIESKLQNLPNSKEILKEAVKVANEMKTLIANLKDMKSIDKPIADTTVRLETLVKKSELIESKLQNLPDSKEILKEALKVANEIKTLKSDITGIKEINVKELSRDITKTTNEIKTVLSELKELSLNTSSKKVPVILEKSQEITQMVEQTLKVANFFSGDLQKATISEQIQRVVNLLKGELLKSDVKASVHVEIVKLTEKLESTLKTLIETKTLVPNQKLQVDTPIKSEIANDIKATLLNMKQELSTSVLSTAREALTQVDRLLTQIDYFQLVSLSSNATTYLPFLWDDLQEGQVSLKKLKENRFFCEINLKLKEYGKIDLMIMLYEDININISVFAEKKEFITLVHENLSALKQGLNKLGLIPANIQLFDALKDKKLKEDTRNFANSATLGAGLNLEV